MSFAVRVVPAIVSFALLAAHFYRGGNSGLAVLSVLAPALLLWRRAWVPAALSGFLAFGFLEWLVTALDLIEIRQSVGLPWMRMAAILGGVAFLTAAGGVLLQEPIITGRYDAAPGRRISVIALALAVAILIPVQIVVEPAGLLLERFWETGGWFEIGLLGLYAAWLTDHMLGARATVWRRRMWTFFSAAFFAQLALGLAGAGRFLMTGELHLPVPALIVAGPLFRGEGFFMPILFGATVLLVGPAWCSHLCYIGAWDNEFARRVRRPADLPAWRREMQLGILLGTVLVAVGLRALGVPGHIAVWPAAAFGLVGVGLMAWWSRRRGVMTHCTAFCPIGAVSTLAGRINPFRLRVDRSCTECGACGSACRYDALRPQHLAEKRVGSSCTLCGDCLSRCRDGHLSMSLPWIGAAGSRAAFVILIVGLHAAFLGVARI